MSGIRIIGMPSTAALRRLDAGYVAWLEREYPGTSWVIEEPVPRVAGRVVRRQAARRRRHARARGEG